MNTIPREYRNAILLAVTTTKRCVGIKIFNDSNVSDQNGNLDDNFEDYIDRCVRDAADLKISIEAGMHDFENDPRIVKNPQSVPSYVTVDQLLEIQSKRQTQLMLLKNETVFIDLGRTMIQSVEIGRFNYFLCILCLSELGLMIRDQMLTPLMLKKNPDVVIWIAKLCRFSDERPSTRGQANVLERPQQVRTESRKILNLLKELMGFDGSNQAFLEYFSENVELFRELTANLTDIEKQQLTIDPELNLMTSIDDD